MNNIENQIKSHIEDITQPLWIPRLTLLLVDNQWEQFKKVGVSKSNYSSDKILSGTDHSKTPFNYLSFSNIDISEIPKVLEDRSSNSPGYIDSEFTNSSAPECVQEALSNLLQIPSISNTVNLLVANMHLLKPHDNGYDVSYSLPELPFSIFVSVPTQRVNFDALRVAESILHEAMHLQLSLIDKVVPLLENTYDKEYFSPWRNEFRHPIGVLHGLYVFRVIQLYLRKLTLTGSANLYRIERIADIEKQISQVIEFKDFEGLTATGHVLTERIFKNS